MPSVRLRMPRYGAVLRSRSASSSCTARRETSSRMRWPQRHREHAVVLVVRRAVAAPDVVFITLTALSEEKSMFQQSVRDFAVERIRPPRAPDGSRRDMSKDLINSSSSWTSWASKCPINGGPVMRRTPMNGGVDDHENVNCLTDRRLAIWRSPDRYSLLVL